MAFADYLTIKLIGADIAMVRSVNVNSQGLTRSEVYGEIR